jgi:D-glycero-D-manno-heptose 1,7-bisphosphate phosphatase
MIGSGRGLFVDRDGVVNREQGYVWHLSDFVLEPAFLDLAVHATSLGYRIVVVTNQGGIGKGLYTEADVELLHRHLCATLADLGVPAPLIFSCPHHPTTSACLCRKPSTLLFERALHLYQLNPSECWMLGDRARDVIPAKQLGMHTVLITSHSAEEGSTPEADLLVPTILEASSYLIRQLTEANSGE